ncbi:MAG: hypothetical protein ACTH1D_11290 [Mycobacteriaceae bacterium]
MTTPRQITAHLRAADGPDAVRTAVTVHRRAEGGIILDCGPVVVILDRDAAKALAQELDQ